MQHNYATYWFEYVLLRPLCFSAFLLFFSSFSSFTTSYVQLDAAYATYWV